MERETIERLAMDSALGELNDDVATLLEAYLVDHPEARSWAGPMTQTCLRTQDAISSKAHSRERNDPALRTRSPWPVHINGRALIRWAAVIAMALAVGGVLGRRSAPSVPMTAPTVVRAEQDASPKGWDQVLSEPGDGFWQGKAVAMLQSKSYEVSRPRHARTGLWDRYRQSRKGRSYE